MFTPEHGQKVLQAIAAKLGRVATCPLCAGTKWDTSGYIAAAEAPDGKPKIPGPAKLFIDLGCRQCGHTMLFDPRYLGLTPEQLLGS